MKMKGINISCASHSSTSIYTPISMDQPSSSSSSSLISITLLEGSSGGGGGSRAIDRHNPIIADERRISRSTPPTSSNSTPYFTPKFSPLNQKKQTQKTSKKKKLISLTPKIKSTNHDDHHHNHHQLHALKKSPSKPSDLITINSDGLDKISPPESSRYLLDDHEEFGSGFLDRVFSDLDQVLKLKVPCDQPKVSSDELVEVEVPKSLDDCKKPPIAPKSSSSDHHQVVVLRVSLHCRGCEGKVRKHISRMQGVKSFNIDFAAKKVTVEGNVTPLEVLASISKVKNAQIWTPPSTTSKTMDPYTHNIY